jgi:hypothetical protein
MTAYHKPKTEFQDWIERRVLEVRKRYSAFDALIEGGVEGLSDEDSDVSIFCPFHHNVNTPAGRYYSKSGDRYDHFYCFSCKINLDSINLYAKFKGQRFMDALLSLERRFRIQIPRRPEPLPIADPIQRGSGYLSEKWTNIPTVLELLEKKLARIRDKCAMIDYIKFCRVIDAVEWDYDKIKKATPEMIDITSRLIRLMDENLVLPDFSLQNDKIDTPV